MLKRSIIVTLKIAGPVLSQATAAGEPGIDSPAARDRDGRPLLPGTLIKGRLRQSWEELKALVGDAAFGIDIAEWLGRGELTEDENAAPGAREMPRFPGGLRFTDFTAPEPRPADLENIRYRIQIDPDTGSVRKGSFQVIDCPFASGEEAEFTGTIDWLAVNESEADQLQDRLIAGLQWTTHFGADRGIGYGRLLAVTLVREEDSPITTGDVNEEATAPEFLDLEIAPEDPLLLTRPQISGNSFETSDTIAGNVLKGALAETIRQASGALSGAKVEGLPDDAPFPHLRRHFDALRFLEARPAPVESMARPVTPPLSIVKTGKGADLKWWDAATMVEPGLINGETPAFFHDWKNGAADIKRAYGWAEVETELRVRTAIDWENRKSEATKLFAHERIEPDPAVVWRSRVDLSPLAPDARNAVASELRLIFQSGLRSLGKSRANAAVRILSEPFAEPEPFRSSAATRSDRWIVTLQTDALLLDPRRRTGAASAESMAAGYREAWESISGNALTLDEDRFFSDERLAGGLYLWRRFQPDEPYRPWLLTGAGSVFVLKAGPEGDEAAKTAIESLLRSGLPLPAWAVEEYGDRWDACPFLPENGFGEVTVNLPIHFNRAPAAEKGVGRK